VQDPTANREGGKDSSAPRVPVSRRRGAALESAGGNVVGVLEGDGEVDEMRLGVMMSNAWPVWSCSSCNGDEGWLERSPLQSASVARRIACPSVDLAQTMASGDARDQVKRLGTEKRRLASGGSESEKSRWRVCGAPALNFVSLAALFCKEVEGKRRGERELFIGVAGASS
jgi:hypothetical protein